MIILDKNRIIDEARRLTNNFTNFPTNFVKSIENSSEYIGEGIFLNLKEKCYWVRKFWGNNSIEFFNIIRNEKKEFIKSSYLFKINIK